MAAAVAVAASVDGIDGRCRCCGVARVTRPRVVLVLLATESSRTSMGDLCVGDDTVRVAGIIAVGGQQLL